MVGIVAENFALSSNGKKADSESVNQGSSPCRASIFIMKR